MNGLILVLSGVVFFLIVLVIATALKCSQDQEKPLMSTGNHAPRNGTNNLTRRNSGGGTNDFVIDTGGNWGANDFGGGLIQREIWIQEPAPPYVPSCSSHQCDQVLQIEQIPESRKRFT